MEADSHVYYLTGLLGHCPAHSEPSINVSYLLLLPSHHHALINRFSLGPHTTPFAPSYASLQMHWAVLPEKCFLLSWLLYFGIHAILVSSLLSSFHVEILLYLWGLSKLPSLHERCPHTPNLSDFSSTLYHCIWTLFGACILYSWSLKAGQMSYSKFYSLQLLCNILRHTMLRIYLQVEWIDTTDILLTYLLQCDYSGEEGWEYKQVQGDQLVLLGPLLV